MTKIGIGLPGLSVTETRATAEAAAVYDFDSFSVYGDLGDLPPYAVLHAIAYSLEGSHIPRIGPMGVPVGLLRPEAIASHAIALEQQLPGQSYVGLVRGAFLDQIGEKPAPLARVEETVKHLRRRFVDEGIDPPPIYLGGFGPRLLKLAGALAVDGIKLGGSVNPALAEQARTTIGNNKVKIVVGAVSVIDKDRHAARQLARHEVAKYLAVVGELDPNLYGDELESLARFNELFSAGDKEAYMTISDDLLNKFAIAGTPDDALAVVESMNGVADRIEFGTPHGLGDRPSAIHYIGNTIMKELER